MSKLKVEVQPPSEQVVAKMAEKFIVTDAKGRAITLKKPGVLAQFRLIEAVGDSAKNQVYMAMILPLIFVIDIDGEAVYQPNSKREVEALIQQLDEEGITAVSTGVQANFGATDPEADKAALKN